MMPKVRARRLALHSLALGSTILASAILIPFDSAAAGAKVLYAFTGGADGSQPYGTLARDGAGNLYGTTYYSNAGCEGRGGCGTVFRLSPSGSETVLHSFHGGSDAAHPLAGVVLDESGNVFGTTESGGGGDCDAGFGCGTIFKVNSAGTETVLHAFSGKDGEFPFAGLIRDGGGNLYGTTLESYNTYGEVFELTARGKLKVLHGFTGGKDGMYPTAEPTMDGAGNLYGTTSDGGGFTCSDSEYGRGTVYKIGTDGSESIIYAFKGGADGAHPNSALVADAAGNLYGTTLVGGGSGCDGYGCGTVFKIGAGGAETVSYVFKGRREDDGSRPSGRLVLAGDGTLYGATLAGGGHNGGTLFRLTTDGTETVLYSFREASGTGPNGVIADEKLHLYGTAQDDGANGHGTVFELKGNRR